MSWWPSALSNARWELIGPTLTAWWAERRGKGLDWTPFTTLYVARAGIPWRYLRQDFTPWETVYGYFAAWQKEGVLDQLNGLLQRLVRQAGGRSAEPSACLPHSTLGLLFGVDKFHHHTDRRGDPHAAGPAGLRGLRPAWPEPAGADGRVRLCAQAEGIALRLDAAEIQVRRPVAGRGGHSAFVSGKKQQNTMKAATVTADYKGRTLWSDTLRPGRMPDATAGRNEGIAVCFQHYPDVEVLLDDGCLGLRRDHPGQAITPPRKPNKSALPDVHAYWDRSRHWHSSDRITVERAIVGLVSDRTKTT
ncbi:transposase [Streptomyces spiralis]